MKKKKYLFLILSLIFVVFIGINQTSAETNMQVTTEGNKSIEWVASERTSSDVEVALTLDNDKDVVFEISVDDGLSIPSGGYPTENTPNIGQYIKKVEKKNNYIKYYFNDYQKAIMKLEFKVNISHANLWTEENLKINNKLEIENELVDEQNIPIHFTSEVKPNIFYANSNSDYFSVVAGAKFSFTINTGTLGDVASGISRPKFVVNKTVVPLPKGISLVEENDDHYMDYSDVNNPKLVINKHSSDSFGRNKAYNVQLQADFSLDVGEYQSSLETNANVTFAQKYTTDIKRQAPIFKIIAPKALDYSISNKIVAVDNKKSLLGALSFTNNQVYDLNNVKFKIGIPEVAHIYAINMGSNRYNIAGEATFTYTTNKNNNKRTTKATGANQFISRNKMGLDNDEWLKTLEVSYESVKPNESIQSVDTYIYMLD